MATDAKADLWKLVKSIKICMMTTRDDGVLRSRPMQAHLDGKDGDALLFLTRLSDDKVDELRANNEVNLSFAEPDDDNFASISGRAEVSRERALIDEVWNAYGKAYFDGKDDPDAAVIRVTPTQAEYWEGNNTAQQVWEMAKALVGGPEPDLGKNRKLAL